MHARTHARARAHTHTHKTGNKCVAINYCFVAAFKIFYSTFTVTCYLKMRVDITPET